MSKVHNKQFVISNVNLTWDANEWQPQERSLFGKYRIYYDENLNIKFGANGVLIGNAIPGDKSAGETYEILEQEISDVSEKYESWNGRWILIYKNQIHLDANGQLGLFYGRIKDEQWIASSSLALINKATKRLLETEEFLPIEMGFGSKSLLYWNPGPNTLLRGIKRLLPTQLLYLEEGKAKIEYRDTINKHDFTNLSIEEIYWKIFEQQINVYENILKKYKKINMALTAGYDSRLQFAIMIKGNIPFSCHSFEREKNTAIADEKIAPEIAKRLGIEYKYISLQHGIDAKRVIDYNKHTFGNVKDMDYKWHYPYHQFDAVNGDVYVRGSLYEGFCNYYEHYNPKSTYEDSIDFIMDDLRKLYKTLGGNTGAEASFYEYCQWVKAHPTPKMTFIDMLAYEQLFGCWMSDVSQGMDLIWDGLFINPANSMRIFSLITSLPRDKRNERVWEAEMVQMLCPDIADIPYNNAALSKGISAKIKQTIYRLFS